MPDTLIPSDFLALIEIPPLDTLVTDLGKLHFS